MLMDHRPSTSRDTSLEKSDEFKGWELWSLQHSLMENVLGVAPLWRMRVAWVYPRCMTSDTST